MKKKSHVRYYQNLLHRYLIFKPKLTILSTRDSDFLYSSLPSSHPPLLCKSTKCLSGARGAPGLSCVPLRSRLPHDASTNASRQHLRRTEGWCGRDRYLGGRATTSEAARQHAPVCLPRHDACPRNQNTRNQKQEWTHLRLGMSPSHTVHAGRTTKFVPGKSL